MNGLKISFFFLLVSESSLLLALIHLSRMSSQRQLFTSQQVAREELELEVSID